MLNISTSKYKAEKKVLVDGNKTWTVKLPSARTELALSQYTRRGQLLQKKSDDGTATEEDLDKLEKLENEMYNIYLGLFSDEKDGAEVNPWLEASSFAAIQKFLEDVKEQSETNDGEAAS